MQQYTWKATVQSGNSVPEKRLGLEQILPYFPLVIGTRGPHDG
jgi:hypothetical protein